MIARQVVAPGLLLSLVSGPALAHSPIEGIGNFYNGLLHPVFVPAHWLLLVALGLLIGQNGIYPNRAAFAAFLAATAIGLIGAWFSIGGEMEMVLLGAAVVIGLAIAASLSMRPSVSVILAVLVGLLVGIDSAQQTLSGKDKLLTLVGTGVGISLLMIYAIGLADFFNKKAWQKIGIRVVGSWIAASSLLVLALSFASMSSP